MLQTTFMPLKKVRGDMEPGDRRCLVITLPAFLCLAPVHPETIYTAREEAPITYSEDSHPGPVTNFMFSNSWSFDGAITRTEQT